MFGAPRFTKVLAAARILVYTVGFLRLLYWHVSQTFIAYRSKAQLQLVTLQGVDQCMLD